MAATFIEKVKRFFTLEDEYSYSEDPESESATYPASASTHPPPARAAARGRGTLISLPSPKKQEVLILEPGTFAEATEIAEALKHKKCIILNMRRTDKDLSRRIVDFLSGISYAMNGYTQKVADQIYLYTPSHIEIFVPERVESGDSRASGPQGGDRMSAGTGTFGEKPAGAPGTLSMRG